MPTVIYFLLQGRDNERRVSGPQPTKGPAINQLGPEHKIALANAHVQDLQKMVGHSNKTSKTL